MIPENKIAEGILLCQENVDRLAADAHILGEFGSHGHALASIILAMEEYAKKLILYAYILSPKLEHDEYVKNAFMKHEFKLQWVVSTIIQAFNTQKVMEELELSITKLSKRLQTEKLSGIYVDYNKNMGWINPNRPENKDQYKILARSLAHLIDKIEPWITEPYKQKRNLNYT